MGWIVLLVALGAACLYGAHRLAPEVDGLWLAARVPVYAAAVVVAAQLTDLAIGIDQVTSREFGETSGQKAQGIVQVLSGHLSAIAWQAGLLLAAAVLLASRQRAAGTAAR